MRGLFNTANSLLEMRASPRDFFSVSAGSSDKCAPANAVPQRSVLKPLLFLIYINHCWGKFSSACKLFVDNRKIRLSFIDRIPFTTDRSSCFQTVVEEMAARHIVRKVPHPCKLPLWMLAEQAENRSCHHMTRFMIYESNSSVRNRTCNVSKSSLKV